MAEANRRTVSRRQLMKALAATGGVVAASALVPNKWAKPALKVGVLPAHAQTTCGILDCIGFGDGSAPDRVLQGGGICGIMCAVAECAECEAIIRCDVTADPAPHGDRSWTKLKPVSCRQDPEDVAGVLYEKVAFFPCFRVPRDAPIGTKIDFTFMFADDTYGFDRCHFRVVVEQGGEGGETPSAATEWGSDEE